MRTSNRPVESGIVKAAGHARRAAPAPGCSVRVGSAIRCAIAVSCSGGADSPDATLVSRMPASALTSAPEPRKVGVEQPGSGWEVSVRGGLGQNSCRNPRSLESRAQARFVARSVSAPAPVWLGSAMVVIPCCAVCPMMVVMRATVGVTGGRPRASLHDHRCVASITISAPSCQRPCQVVRPRRCGREIRA